MSLLQENIVYILLIPLVLQIFFPLAMCVVYLIGFPFWSLLKRKGASESQVDEEFTSIESLV